MYLIIFDVFDDKYVKLHQRNVPSLKFSLIYDTKRGANRPNLCHDQSRISAELACQQTVHGMFTMLALDKKNQLILVDPWLCNNVNSPSKN